MTGKMKAVVKTRKGPGAEMVTADIPPVGAREVLVKVKATSICGTDVHIYTWDPWAQGRIRKIPQVLGHEFAGEVVEIGKEVRHIKIGDTISAETHIPCGECIQCLTDQMHICNNLSILGVDRDGCFAEYAVIPEVVCWKNSRDIPYEYATVQEPLGNAVYATLVEDVAGKTVAVIGEGPTGLFAVGVARACGATEIFALGKNRYRLEIAKKMGADHTIMVSDTDAVAFILERTNGIGVDVVLEMAGAQQAIDDGIRIIRKGGRFSAFGIPPGNVRLDYANGIIFKGITLYGINGRLMYSTWFKVRNLLASKRLDVSPVVTHKMPMSDFAEGFRLLTEGESRCGKVVLIP
ncbi:MAG: L-threonine 3-dehydrogenase [Candidatus Eremiobacteraeota bacterium]|nr:L-threonine 3-dehydrogenase [Candidatus Eremiobacteraeota bacterium]